MIIYIGVGTNDVSHDGYNITAKYITSISSREGIVFIAGTGNAGASEGHALGFIKNVAEISIVINYNYVNCIINYF